MDKIIVSVIGLSGIVLTYWYFLSKNETGVKVQSSIDILVKGGYTPSKILIRNNKTAVLNFIRKDSNSCLEDVVIPGFKIKKFLPINQKVSIEVTPQKKGEYDISCGMNMFHGKIIVE